MRMRSFDTVTMCVVPTAPIVSGGMLVALRNSPLNVFIGGGEMPVPNDGVESVVALGEAVGGIGTGFWNSGRGWGGSISSVSSFFFGGCGPPGSPARLKCTGGERVGGARGG